MGSAGASANATSASKFKQTSDESAFAVLMRIPMGKHESILSICRRITGIKPVTRVAKYVTLAKLFKKSNYFSYLLLLFLLDFLMISERFLFLKDLMSSENRRVKASDEPKQK